MYLVFMDPRRPDGENEKKNPSGVPYRSFCYNTIYLFIESNVTVTDYGYTYALHNNPN